LVVGLTAVAMLGAFVPTLAAPTAAAETVTVENITNAELLPETEDGPPPGWSWLGWDTAGGTGLARVEVDDTEPVQHDGSLHVATPGASDWVQLRQVVPLNRSDGPTLQGLAAGSIDLRAVAGPPPELVVKVDCNARASSSPEAAFTLTYAGSVPSDGTWHHVDVVDGGAAMWWSDATMNADGSKESASQLPTPGGLKGGPGSPHPLSEYVRVCTDSLIRSYGVRQGVEGADGYVDNLRLGARSTNFWVPVLTRLAGPDRRATACEAAKHQFTNTLEYADGSWWNPAAVRDHPRAVVVVNETSFPDALAAGPLANALHGALLLSNGRDKAPCMPDLGIERVDTVYLVGGTAVLGRSVELAYRQAGIGNIHRIGGADRFDTAVKVAREIDRRRPSGSDQTVFLASGTDFADALSAGAPAGHLGGAVLLTSGTRMPSATAAYLAEQPSATVYAVGGPAAAAADLPSSNEIVGPNRFETATMVADRFFPAPTSAAFASGVRFPDALAAAAYGGHVGTPVVLVGPDAVPNAVLTYAQQHRSTLRGSVLLGGDNAVHWYTADLLTTRLTPPH
jgi:putative cell wall-binding protein